MKLLNFVWEGHRRLGLMLEGGVLDASAADSALPDCTDEVIREGEPCLRRLAALERAGGPLMDPEAIEYAPAVLAPRLILCVGLNYHEHLSEAGERPVPAAPVWFSKLPGSLSAHRQPIVLCRAARQHDAEAEIVAVIGRGGRYIKKEAALDHLFGYTLGNDISARDLQRRSSQWLIGKACDGFGPVGPVIATRDSVDAARLDIRGYINGEQRQSSDAAHMIFDVPTLIADVSQFVALSPGDLIFTGTCGGVIMGRKPPLIQDWLKPGDLVSVASSQIGELVNPIAEG